jgi:AraC-like DNA-binding protein
MKTIPFYLALIIAAQSYAQKVSLLSNEEYTHLQSKAKENVYINIDSSFYYANKIEASANNSHKAFATATKGYLYQLKNDSIKSNKYLVQSYFYLNKLPSSIEKTKLHAYILNCDGLTDSEKYKLNTALEKFQKGKKLSEKIGDIIQVFKFNSNIAALNVDIENYKLAITTHLESAAFLKKARNEIPKEEYNFLLANTLVSISDCYNELYLKNRKQSILLDSALFYCKKSIDFTKDNSILHVKIMNNLGNIYSSKNNYTAANLTYLKAMDISKTNNMVSNYVLLANNLGYINFITKKYSKSLQYFQKIDSVYYRNKGKIYKIEYIFSNYYQAKIYDALHDKSKVIVHSKIYLDKVSQLEKFESDLLDEAIEINHNLNNLDLKKEMTNLNNQYKNDILYRKIVFVGLVLSGILLLLLMIRNFYEKQKTNQKVKLFIEQYNNSIEIKRATMLAADRHQEQNSSRTSEKGPIPFSLDEVKENEIINLLQKLQDKKKFLDQNFTQQAVAKKIKTNTTYLSYVINKRFGKTFSEYSNELKINYAINEMINNSLYQTFTAQAMAESVGFKNAVSFSKSFRKKTGVSPAQFLKAIKSKLPT